MPKKGIVFFAHKAASNAVCNLGFSLSCTMRSETSVSDPFPPKCGLKPRFQTSSLQKRNRPVAQQVLQVLQALHVLQALQVLEVLQVLYKYSTSTTNTLEVYSEDSGSQMAQKTVAHRRLWLVTMPHRRVAHRRQWLTEDSGSQKTVPYRRQCLTKDSASRKTVAHRRQCFTEEGNKNQNRKSNKHKNTTSETQNKTWSLINLNCSEKYAAQNDSNLAESKGAKCKKKTQIFESALRNERTSLESEQKQY